MGGAVAALIRLLRDEDWRVRSRALVILPFLCRKGDACAITALTDLIEGTDYLTYELRQQAVWTLCNICERSDAGARIVRLLEHAAECVRLAALGTAIVV